MKKFVITQSFTSRESEAFKRYMQEVAKIPLLSEEEEYEIALKAHKGDIYAIQKLVRHNLRFVISVAKQYVCQEAPLGDLLNEGNIGLQMAAERFEPSRGFRFISYAIWWIKRKVLEYLTNQSRMIRIPGNKVGNINKIKRIMGKLEQTLEREPSLDELANYMNEQVNHDPKKMFTLEQLEFMLGLDSAKINSLDNPIDDEGFTMIDIIPDSSTKATDYLMYTDDKSTIMETLLSTLKPRHREVLEYLYGLKGGEQLTLVETGEEMGISRERVRQLRDAAEAILREKIKTNGWHDMISGL